MVINNEKTTLFSPNLYIYSTFFFVELFIFPLNYYMFIFYNIFLTYINNLWEKDDVHIILGGKSTI